MAVVFSQHRGFDGWTVDYGNVTIVQQGYAAKTDFGFRAYPVFQPPNETEFILDLKAKYTEINSIQDEMLAMAAGLA